MKNNLLKYYIVAFYLCSTFVMFAQADPDEGDGDTTPTGPLPIDKYVVLLAVVGLVFVFLKFREMQNNKVNS